MGNAGIEKPQAVDDKRKCMRRAWDKGDVVDGRVNQARKPAAEEIGIVEPVEKSPQAVSSRRAQWRATASVAQRGSWPKVAVFRYVQRDSAGNSARIASQSMDNFTMTGDGRAAGAWLWPVSLLRQFIVMRSSTTLQTHAY